MNNLTTNENEQPMSNIEVSKNIYAPQNFEQALKLADMIANSTLCPPGFKNKPGDVYIAMTMGAEVGLSPMQAIQNIAVINGRPCLWGDAVLAIVRSNKHCESVNEWMEGSFREKNAVAYCEIKRRGQDVQVRTFSYDQALIAGLINKAGTWKQYPERMLQMRARGFCARDVFPDALRGISIAEEVMDYDVVSTDGKQEVLRDKPKSRGMDLLKSKLNIQVVQEKEPLKENETADPETGEIVEPVKKEETPTADHLIFLIESSADQQELTDCMKQYYSKLSAEDKKLVAPVFKKKDAEFKEHVTE